MQLNGDVDGDGGSGVRNRELLQELHSVVECPMHSRQVESQSAQEKLLVESSK